AGRRSSAQASCTRVGGSRGASDGFAPEGSVFSVSNGSSSRSVPTARQGTGSWISHQEGNGLRVFEQGPGVALVTARSEDILDSRALALLPRVLLLARRGGRANGRRTTETPACDSRRTFDKGSRTGSHEWMLLCAEHGSVCRLRGAKRS